MWYFRRPSCSEMKSGVQGQGFMVNCGMDPHTPYRNSPIIESTYVVPQHGKFLGVGDPC